jgi:hypothetical protein
MEEEEKKEDPDDMKSKLKELKAFHENATGKLFGYNEPSLEKLEPQMVHKQHGKRSKMLLKLTIAVVIFSTIVLNAFEKLGSEKI